MKIKRLIKQFNLYGLASIITLFILFPIIFAILTSFKPNSEIFIYPPRMLPYKWTLSAYSIFINTKYLRYFFNSFLISIFSSFICLFLGSLAGYGFSRFKIPAKRFLMIAILSLQMFPGAVLMIPYFNIARMLSIYDTYLVLILINVTFSLPLIIWLVKSYFDAIPISLEEAARLDGCNRLQVIFYIVIPLARAGFIAACLLAFMKTWNEFMFGLILTKGPAKAPVTVGLAELFGQYAINWNSVMALTVVMTIPLIILFIFLQRYVISGLSAGAFK